MSDGTIPRNSPSGEFRVRLQSALSSWASTVTIAVVLVGVILYVGSKPSTSEVRQMIATHEAKNKHHGVDASILRAAPTRTQHELLKLRVEQLEAVSREWRKEVKVALKEIKRTLRELADRLPRRYRRRK